MRKVIFCLCFLVWGVDVGSSSSPKTLIIPEPMVVNPYEILWEAVCVVESHNNPLAYNSAEKAFGIAQIRPIFLKEYENQTGIHYDPKDCFDVVVSKKVFMHFAAQIGHHNPEKIMRNYNGGPRGMSKQSTKVYWNKIQEEMTNIKNQAS